MLLLYLQEYIHTVGLRVYHHYRPAGLLESVHVLKIP